MSFSSETIKKEKQRGCPLPSRTHTSIPLAHHAGASCMLTRLSPRAPVLLTGTCG